MVNTMALLDRHRRRVTIDTTGRAPTIAGNQFRKRASSRLRRSSHCSRLAFSQLESIVSGMKLLIFSNAREGRDDEFNTWYDGVHLAEMLEVPGVNSATRYRAQATGSKEPDHRYLAIYDVDDAAATLREIGARSADGRFQLSDSADPARTKITVWESL
jgi:hypothetical protein